MGFFKSIKKGWKDALGWVDDKETLAIGTGIALGALTGGIGFAAAGIGGIAGLSGGATGAILGGAVGATKGIGDVKSLHAQEKAQQAQLAAAQRIADAQNPVNLVTAVTPNASTENAQVSEENMANEAKRRYSFSKLLYKNRSRLGNSGSAENSATRTTLG